MIVQTFCAGLNFSSRNLLDSAVGGTFMHSFKNRTDDRTGEAIGLGFYWLDHWFTGLISGFLS
jgi:hypothetical protein